MLTRKEFDMLVMLAGSRRRLSQREMAQALGCSLGTVNKLLRSCGDRGLQEGGALTDRGLAVLEPYRVKRAVFIAAGFDSRLAPITLNTPKPLIRVNGVRMIDTLLDAVVRAGIPEIVIVRGYLGEQFDQLRCRYPNIRFVDNPLYNECNNISSAMCVRELFRSAYVLDADLVLNNPELIRTYEYQSHLVGCPVERTDSWCVTVDRSGYVDSVTVGGTDGYREAGIFYWTEEDGARLAEDLKEVYEAPGGKSRYWEQTPLVYKRDRYRVAVRPCSSRDITEINTFSELKQVDRAYDL